jgi:hypothetical protein
MTIQEPYNGYSEEISRMRKIYLESERQFIEFDNIVPYADNDDKVYSPRLVNMLYGIELQIDGMLKILIKLLSLKPKRQTFPSYIKELNSGGMLSIQEIHFRESRRVMVPFFIDSEYNTTWHKAYNDTKHQLPKGMYSGKYGNVANALAALAILHEIVYTIAYRESYRKEALNKEYWHPILLLSTEMGNFRRPFS